MKFNKIKKKETSLENTYVSQVIDNEAAVVVPFARVGAIATGQARSKLLFTGMANKIGESSLCMHILM